jgi:hypothetical protein
MHWMTALQVLAMCAVMAKHRATTNMLRCFLDVLCDRDSNVDHLTALDDVGWRVEPIGCNLWCRLANTPTMRVATASFPAL